MSRENVEFVDRLIAVFNRRDLQALAEMSDEDIEFNSVLAELDGGRARFRGHAGWAQYFEVMDQTWEDWHIEDVRLLEGEEGVVVAICSIGGTGRQSGVRARQTVGITFRQRHGKAWRIRSHRDPDEALAEAGLG